VSRPSVKKNKDGSTQIVREMKRGTKSNRLALSTSKFTKSSTGTFSETGTRARRSVRKANRAEEKTYAKARTKKHRDKIRSRRAKSR